MSAWNEDDHLGTCRSVPVIVATGAVLDTTDEAAWQQYYHRCHVGVLTCGNCARPLYLRQREGRREVVAYTDRDIRLHENQSQEHRALKELVAIAAERQGLTPVEEDRATHGRRITDVRVSGGTHEVGWEIQLSGISTETLKRRVNRAISDDIRPSWLSLSGSKVAEAIDYRAPLSLVRSMTAMEYLAVPDLPLTGVKTVRPVRCTGRHTVATWHRGKTCSGWHAELGVLTEGNPTLVRMVEGTAFGAYVPVRWPRQYKGRDPLVWMTPEDEQRLRNLEGDSGAGSRAAAPLVDDQPARLVQTSHVPLTPVPTPRPDLTAVPGLASGLTGDWLDQELGPMCPGCGWRRGRHRPAGAYTEACPLASIG
jgi:hypothetical protein